MFDLITGKTRHLPRHQTVPILVSTSLQAAALGLVLLSVLVATEQIPEIPTMMAFVAPAPPPPAPPPPPPPKIEARPIKPVPTTGAAVIPVEAPSAIAPEPAAGGEEGEEGVPEGVEGGIPGGVVGGIVGGLPDLALPPPPPPPPPPPAPRAPVRVGGVIKQPTLLHRVEPVYPPLAAAAAIQGTVILEALVDEQGFVQDVKVLRSIGVLDRSAIDAVKQWRYSPVILNGRPEKFILTVVLTFRLEG
jgi:protein TonB